MTEIFQYVSEIDSCFESTDTEVLKIISKLYSAMYVEVDEDTRFRLDFVLRELINNAIEHGNKMEPWRKVRICILIQDSMVNIDVFDQGTGFDLDSTLDRMESMESLRTRSRGLKAIIDLGFALRAEKGHVSCFGKCKANQVK